MPQKLLHPQNIQINTKSTFALQFAKHIQHKTPTSLPFNTILKIHQKMSAFGLTDQCFLMCYRSNVKRPVLAKHVRNPGLRI